MGLIKSAVSSIGGTLGEQWEDYIKCDSLDNDTLMVKMTTKTGQISARSRIQVNPGQCAIIMDSGKILDATAEEGIYTFDASTSPTLFAGQFGGMFKEMWQRFTYNGVAPKEQAIYYVNITEIKDNKFGTPNPIPFQDWSHPIPNQMTGTVSPLRVEIKCHGKYTFTISDPMTFIRNVGTASVYRKEEMTEQMRSEVIAAFQNVANELGNSNHKVPVLEMPSATDEIQTMMEEKEFDAAIRKRGISLVSFSVESVILDDESSRKIDNYELSSNSFMQQGTLTGAYANAVQDAAKNEGGAMNGFMGVGMMNMASGGMMGGVAQAPFNNQNQSNSFKQMEDPFAQKQEPVQQPTAEQTVTPVTTEAVGETVDKKFCANCGNEVTGKFCTDCGTKYEEQVPQVKKCSKCGVEVTSKFCSECGTPVSE